MGFACVCLVILHVFSALFFVVFFSSDRRHLSHTYAAAAAALGYKKVFQFFINIK